MNINSKTFKDKIYACWVGKNIGGTMGTPYEGRREVLDVKGYVTKAGEVLPNDDLDIQLVWLDAITKLGPLGITPNSLGEIWLSYIVARWNEYGIGAVNMQKGLFPPLSADYDNSWANSNGAWIRTEIWACLAPGSPQTAAKYAVADACIDHGTQEGTSAAVFVAAMQSAAFVVKDVRKCIEIGLSYIPESSRMAKTVREIFNCFDSGMNAIDCRNYIQKLNADIGDGWFEAPSNVGYALIGLLWGNGDFKKSMLTAINCGDDTDCTAGTVGATLGIMFGLQVIPEDWRAYIGDEIVTFTFNKTSNCYYLPRTCTELTRRVCEMTPYVLFANRCDVTVTDNENEASVESVGKMIERAKSFNEFLEPNSMTFDNNFLCATVSIEGKPEINPNETVKIKLTVKNKFEIFDNHLYNLNLRWWLPDGFSVRGRKSLTVLNRNAHSNGKASLEFEITAGDLVSPKNKCILEISADSRPTSLYIPIILLG